MCGRLWTISYCSVLRIVINILCATSQGTYCSRVYLHCLDLAAPLCDFDVGVSSTSSPPPSRGLLMPNYLSENIVRLLCTQDAVTRILLTAMALLLCFYKC